MERGIQKRESEGGRKEGRERETEIERDRERNHQSTDNMKQTFWDKTTYILYKNRNNFFQVILLKLNNHKIKKILPCMFKDTCFIAGKQDLNIYVY